MNYRVHSNIRTPNELGIACIGDPLTSVAPASPQNRIDRAEYGRRLADMEGGGVTPQGYLVPVKHEGE